MVHSRLFKFLPIVLLFLQPGCANHNRSPSDSSSGLDPKLSQFTYIEEGDLVAFAVSTRPTRYRLDRKFIPLEIAVANKGLPQLSLTPESFTLVDAQGKQYPAVGRDELSRGYGSTGVDRRLGEIAAVFNSKFSSYTRVNSNLSPSFDRPVPRDVFLPRFGYIVDFVYFPRPEGEIVNKPLELVMRAPELPDPVFVRFEIKGKSQNK